jgi:hypothetical protein
VCSLAEHVSFKNFTHIEIICCCHKIFSNAYPDKEVLNKTSTLIATFWGRAEWLPEVYCWVSRGWSIRLITQLPFNAVVQSECRYASMSHLHNYIFMEGSCFAETNIHLASVASFNLTYFNFI